MTKVESVRLPKVELAFLSLDGFPKETFNWADTGLTYIPWKGESVFPWLKDAGCRPRSIFPGDFLTMHLVVHATGRTTMIRAEPLRFWEGSSVVESWRARESCGVLSNRVFFVGETVASPDAIGSGRRVRFYAVECEPHPANLGCTWRAVRIVPEGFRTQRGRTEDQTKQSVSNIKSERLRSLLEQPKDGVSVIPDELVVRDRLEQGEIVQLHLLIVNQGEDDRTLTGVDFASAVNSRLSILSKNEFCALTSLPLTVQGGGEVKVEIQCQGGLLGRSRELVTLRFVEGFEIGLFVVLEVTHHSLANAEGNDGGYFKRWQDSSRRLENGTLSVLPGRRRQSNQRTFLPRRLKEYSIPEQLESIHREDTTALDTYPQLGEPLTCENYCAKLQALLHLEETALLHQG